jgi:hypothetical protein
MNQLLYDRLIAQGLNEETASALAAEFVNTKPVSQKSKPTLGAWADKYADTNIRLRLQAVMTLISTLGITVSTEMVNELKQVEKAPLETLRRLSQLMDSKWIPQRDAGGKLSKLVDELLGTKSSPEPTTNNPEVDELLNLVSSVTSVEKVNDNTFAVEIVPQTEETVDTEEMSEINSDGDKEDGIVEILTEEDEEIIMHMVGMPVPPKPLSTSSEEIDITKFM